MEKLFIEAMAIGYIYDPNVGTCARRYTFTAPPGLTIADIPPAMLRDLVRVHAGDFAHIADYYAVLIQGKRRKIVKWQSEDSAAIYDAIMGALQP